MLGLLCLCLLPTPACAISSVVVLADNSLSLPLSELARAYSRDRQVSVAASFASTQEQTRQIAEGATADLLITARSSWIESLKEQGLVDVYSQTVIAKNRLVLVGAAENNLATSLEKGLSVPALLQSAGGDMTFLIGNAEFLVQGGYAMEALRRMDAMQDIEPYMSYSKQVGPMLEVIAQGNYGLLFSTDIATDRRVRALAIVPGKFHAPIIYQAAVLAGDNMDEARKFLDYLKSPEAKKIIEEYGFAGD